MRRSLLLFALLLAPAPVRAAEFDPKVLDAVVEKALKEFDAPGAAVVVVEHEPGAAAVADRHYVMEDGHVVDVMTAADAALVAEYRRKLASALH